MSSNEGQIVELNLIIATGEDSDWEEIDDLTRDLREELLDLELEWVRQVRGGDVPPGAKSAEELTVGVLLVAVLPAVLPIFVEYLQGWASRSQNRNIKITTDVGGRTLEFEFPVHGRFSKADLDELVGLFSQGQMGEGSESPG